MKKYDFVFFFFFIASCLMAQVVTTDPAIPTAADKVTIYFHALEGTGGLADYTGDIYAHIGLITEKSSDGSDWKYVKAGWNENISDCKLNRISANEYSLELGPDLHTFFACPTSETIIQIALVFRSADGKNEGKDTGGKDIYVEVYEAGLNVFFEYNKNYVLDSPNQAINFTANASIDANLKISINGVEKKSENAAKAISYQHTFLTAGDYWVVVNASTETKSASDSLFVCILGNPQTAALPNGVEDGINYNGNDVTLVLHAPNKNSVLLIGDFNDWQPSNDYLLKKSGDRWWITVENLTAGEEYAFQYLVDQELAIADPYTEKVLDPWNDKWIRKTTYPNLKEYPSGKADGIVSVLQPGADEYEWDVDDFTPPINDKLVIYELLIRDFVSTQDIKDVRANLDYLEELGITAIELMPVNEFEGNNSWGYNPSFYFAFDKNYGTKNDLKAFVDSCHVRGIAVIVDVVFNHSFYQSPLVGLYFDSANNRPAADNPWYNAVSPNTEYSWGADFNHDSPHTQKFIDRALKYWLTEFKIDGFRFDFTKGFTNTSGSGWNYDASRIAHLKRIYDNMKAVNSNAYMILEHFCDNNEEKELANYGMMIWGNNNHAYMQCAMGWNDDASIKNISHKTKGWDYPNLVAYQESHDEERMMYKSLMWGNAKGDYSVKDTATALDRQELAAAFFLTAPGPKMIWQFGELGYHYSIDENGRVGEKPLRWDFYDDKDRKDVYDVYSQLNKLRAKYPVFSSWDFNIGEMSNFTKRINIYHESANVSVVGNFDVEAQWIEPNFSSTGKWYEFFTGDSIDVTSNDMGVELQPGEYRLYSNVKLSVDETQIVKLEREEFIYQEIVIFPIPSSNVIYVKTDRTILNLSLFSITGIFIKEKIVDGNTAQLTVSDLNSGPYLLRIDTENRSIFKRVIVK